MSIQKSDIETVDRVLQHLSSKLEKGEQVILCLAPESSCFYLTQNLDYFDDLYTATPEELKTILNVFQSIVTKKYNYQGE